jgi:hypothetical protein
MPDAEDPIPWAAYVLLFAKQPGTREYRIFDVQQTQSQGFFEFFQVPDSLSIKVEVHSADLKFDYDLEEYYSALRAEFAFGDCLSPERVKLLTFKRRPR